MEFQPRGWRARAALSALALAGLVETMAHHPNHLAFFTAWNGGPGAGWQYANDSNLDWGQERFDLDRWIADVGEPVHVRPEAPTSGLIAISANDRTMPDPNSRFWIPEGEPIARVGYTWFIYRVE
jgi:hypothetical protein